MTGYVRIIPHLPHRKSHMNECPASPSTEMSCYHIQALALCLADVIKSTVISIEKRFDIATDIWFKGEGGAIQIYCLKYK